MSRKFQRTNKRIVVKVGSSVIASLKLKRQAKRLRLLVEQISRIKTNGVEVVLVSSGAIVLGMGELNLKTRPSDLASLQACAAIGQALLMRTYSDLFGKNNIKCAQVLLTWEDFSNRERYNNARHTLNSILGFGVIPVINENDTISTDEIKFGDNDKLSALVSSLIGADLLIMLSDVEGLYDVRGEKKEIFSEIKEVTKEIEGIASGTNKKNISRGGMIAKLDAVKIATHANIPCVIASGDAENVLERILKGERIGTFFMEKEEKLLSRQHWISFGAWPKGKLIVDHGAKEALLKGGKSLLLPGIVSWDGNFKVDDVVVVVDQGGGEIARGITNYSIGDLHKAVDKKGKHEVIHCENLILGQR